MVWVEVEADGVGGDGFGGHADAAEGEPGVNYGEGGEEEDPEGGDGDEEARKGLVPGVGDFPGDQKEEGPEEEDDEPAEEAVDKLELIVHFEAQGWVGDEDHAQQEDKTR